MSRCHFNKINDPALKAGEFIVLIFENDINLTHMDIDKQLQIN